MRRGWPVLLLAMALPTVACKRTGPAAAADAGERPSPPTKVAASQKRCSELTPGASFTIGDRDPRGAKDGDLDGGDEPVARPFAVEVGSAVAHAGGFAVSALRTRAGATTALVAVVARDAGSGRTVELGKVHGNAQAPKLAARGASLVAVVDDSDASGGRLRLAALRDQAGTLEVVWGAEQQQGGGESQEFDVALGEAHGVLVWDEDDRSAKRGVIKLSTFDADKPGTATTPRVVTGKDDAEAPQLATLAGGFWLAWISNGKTPAKPHPHAPPRASASAALPPDDPPDDPLIDLGPRVMVLTQLDVNGSPVSEPIAVTARDAHVLVFQLVGLADGSALVVWQDDPSGPNSSGTSAELARVRSDGSIERNHLDDEAGIGPGGAQVFPLASPKAGGPSAWLSITSLVEATKFAALGEHAQLLDPIAAEPALVGAEPMAEAEGTLLIARQRGLAMELGACTCRPGAAPAKDAGSD